MEQVLDTGWVGRSRRDADEPRLISEEQAEALIAQAREQGVELLGEQGLLRQMTKAVNRPGFSGGRVLPAAAAVGGRSDGSTRFRAR